MTQPCEPDDGGPPTCVLCGSHSIITDITTGEEVCTGCGCVVGEAQPAQSRSRVLPGSEELEGRPHHGVFLTQSTYDRNMNTFMRGNVDSRGNQLSATVMEAMWRMQQRDRHSKIAETAARNLKSAMTEIDRISSQLNLPYNVKEYAAYIYRRALSADLIRGRSIDSFAAAAIYVACRVMCIPRNLAHITEISGRERREITSSYRLLLRSLGIKPPLDSPEIYIPHIISSVNASMKVERAATDLLSYAKRTSATIGKDPRGVAGAAIFLAAEMMGEPLTSTQVAPACGIAVTTLRNRCRCLKHVLGKKLELVNK